MTESFDKIEGSGEQKSSEGNPAEQELRWTLEQLLEERERLVRFVRVVEEEVEKSGSIDFLRPGFLGQLNEATKTALDQFSTSPNRLNHLEENNRYLEGSRILGNKDAGDKFVKKLKEVGPSSPSDVADSGMLFGTTDYTREIAARDCFNYLKSLGVLQDGDKSVFLGAFPLFTTNPEGAKGLMYDHLTLSRKSAVEWLGNNRDLKAIDEGIKDRAYLYDSIYYAWRGGESKPLEKLDNPRLEPMIRDGKLTFDDVLRTSRDYANPNGKEVIIDELGHQFPYLLSRLSKGLRLGEFEEFNKK